MLQLAKNAKPFSFLRKDQISRRPDLLIEFVLGNTIWQRVHSGRKMQPHRD